MYKLSTSLQIQTVLQKREVWKIQWLKIRDLNFWGEVGPSWKYFHKLNQIFQLQTTVFCYQAVGNAVVGA